MSDFALAHAADAETPELVSSALAQLSTARDHSLGFLYVTNDLADAFADIVGQLKTGTGIPHWVGTVGFGVCATGTEYFNRPAIAVLSGRFLDGALRLIPSLKHPDEVASTVDTQFAAGLGVVHGDPRNPQVIEIVSGLARDHETFLVGGLSAAEDAFPQVAGSVVEGGVSGVLLAAGQQVAVGLTQGCSPIGPSHAVTRGEGNLLLTLDDQPALEVLCEDLGVADGVDPRPWLGNIHAALPVAGSDIGDYLVRNLVGIEPSQGLVGIAGEVKTGDRAMFVRRDAESASKDLRRMLDDLKSRTGTGPRAGLYFSCVARGPNLFAEEAYELKAIQETFGDIPIAGFFGNGEISNDRVYGYTGVLTLFI